MTRGWIGVQPRDLTPEFADSFQLPVREGVLVTGVLRDGPAAQAGLKGASRDEKVKEAQSHVLEEQIDNLLLVQKGKDLPGLTVDAEVTKYFNAIQTQYKFNDEAKFHDFLQQQTGKTFEELRDEKKRELIAQRVVSYEVVSKISVPEADLQKYYDEHKAQYMREEEVFLSQIFISLEGKTPEQIAVAQQRALELVARARKGEKFSELARDNWSLGTFELEFAPAPKGVPRVGVQFEIDANGILSVLARDVKTGHQKIVQLKSAVDVRDEDVEKMVAESVEYAFDDLAQRQWIETKRKSGDMLTATATGGNFLADILP